MVLYKEQSAFLPAPTSLEFSLRRLFLLVSGASPRSHALHPHFLERPLPVCFPRQPHSPERSGVTSGSQRNLDALHHQHQLDQQASGISFPSVPHMSTEKEALGKGWQTRAASSAGTLSGGWEEAFFPGGAWHWDGHGRRSLKAAVEGLRRPSRSPRSSAPA